MPEPRWQEIARRQCGAISARQLAMAGVSTQGVATLCRRGDLQRQPGSAVFLAGAAPATYEAALWTATLATGGWLGFATASHLWGMVDEPGDRIDVIVDISNGYRGLSGLKIHRVQIVTRQTTVRHGWPITSQTCSALDHLGRLSRPEATRFADRALQQGWIRRSDIDKRLRDQPGRTGNGRLRDILRITGDGAAAESERVLHRMLTAAGIVGWVANHDIWSGGHLLCSIDVAFVEQRVGIEIDGMAYHVTPDRFQRDRVRGNQLNGLGWQILHFTWGDLTQRPGYVIWTVRNAILGKLSV